MAAIAHCATLAVVAVLLMVMTACLPERNLPGQGASVSEDEVLVASVQLRLNALGYEAGPVDGLLGPRTEAAIRRFQRDSDMAVTGRIDEALYRDLRGDLARAEAEAAIATRATSAPTQAAARSQAQQQPGRATEPADEAPASAGETPAFAGEPPSMSEEPPESGVGTQASWEPPASALEGPAPVGEAPDAAVEAPASNPEPAVPSGFTGWWTPLGSGCAGAAETTPSTLRFGGTACRILSVSPIGGAGSSWRVEASCPGEPDPVEFVLARVDTADAHRLSVTNMDDGGTSLLEHCGS